MSSLGGGQQTGGSVVQTVAPWAAMQGGQIESAAANTAAQQANLAVNNAINTINTNYGAAANALNPTNQQGVQARDLMGQYLGLDPYMPAAAPTSPTAPPDVSSAQGLYNLLQQGNFNSQGVQTSGLQNALNNAANTNGNAGIQAGMNALGLTGNYSPGTQGYSAVANPTLDQLTQLQQTNPDAFNQFGKGLTQGGIDAYNAQLPAYQTALANYNQDKAWADQYKTPLTADQITANITNQPGYQAQLSQGTSAINNDASAKGYLGSGQMLKELMSFGQNTLSQYYGSTLNNLAQIAGAGTQAATNIANLSSQQGNALSTLQNQIGQNTANGTLAGAGAQAQALLSANPEFQTVGQSSQSNLSGIGSLLSGGASLGSALGLF